MELEGGTKRTLIAIPALGGGVCPAVPPSSDPMARMKDQLGLSDDQVVKIKEIFTKDREAHHKRDEALTEREDAQRFSESAN